MSISGSETKPGKHSDFFKVTESHPRATFPRALYAGHETENEAKWGLGGAPHAASGVHGAAGLWFPTSSPPGVTELPGPSARSRHGRMCLTLGGTAVRGAGSAGRSAFQGQDKHPAPRCAPRSRLWPRALCDSHVVPTLGRGRRHRPGTGTRQVCSPGAVTGRGHGLWPAAHMGLRVGCRPPPGRPPARHRGAGRDCRADVT